MENKKLTPGRELLKKCLNKNMKIVLSDQRTLEGIFLCTDQNANIILGSCTEIVSYDNDSVEEEPEVRILGLAMVPGKHIVSIFADQ